MPDPSALSALEALQQTAALAPSAAGSGLTRATLFEWGVSLVIGMVGWFSYQTGKERQWIAYRLNGVAMMIYPYVCSGIWLYLVGAALCGAWYVLRRLEI